MYLRVLNSTFARSHAYTHVVCAQLPAIVKFSGRHEENGNPQTCAAMAAAVIE